MKHVRVAITAHGEEGAVHPTYDVLTNAPFVERATALQWNVTGDTLGILHHVEGDVDAFDEAIGAIDPVVDYELEPAGEGAFYAYVVDSLTAASRGLFGAFAGEGVVVVPPIVYHADGRVTLSVFGPGERLRETVAAIDPPVEVDVEEVGGLTHVPPSGETRLSERQREALAAGLALGYYDVPREASVEDVATALSCAPSTAAEHLRKAEATAVRAILGSW
ncbi:helix-turn-helix domain-containing protein [Halomarina rubra]|uniref:Helix-turn-helix domain-containing protein n=1 Tax=Halomarina rubra TaxID=2071873 RepID=A0ABD6AT18_9EURY|nr:helix-turn-helix domain-containing protein [Halomarina rubra]